MKKSFLFTLGLAALFVAGCSSTPTTPTTVDTGAIHASSYSFIAGGVQKTAPDFADKRQQVHALIQESIAKNLGARGLSRMESGGDVTVAYLVIVGNNASTEAISTYFGYGRDANELQDKAQDAYASDKNSKRFEAGTLLIDIIDTKTNKLLKRSFVIRPILHNPEVQAARIQEAVDATLKDLRVAK